MRLVGVGRRTTRGASTRRTTQVSHVAVAETKQKDIPDKNCLTSGTFTSMIISGNEMDFGKVSEFYMLVLVFSVPSPVEHQICPAVCVLMKLSFDEEHRHAMNELGEFM